MNLIALEFRFRWILWAGAVALATLVLFSRISPKSWQKQLQQYADTLAQHHFQAGLWILAAGFFSVGFLQKFLQWYSLSLNAQDFWLFEDMLRNLLQGAPFLTRFGPQAPGLLQHGGVHPFWSLYGVLPLAWGLGTTLTTLILGPLALSLAAVVLGFLSKPVWGPLGAWLTAFCFLSSTQVGRILGYDVHPEVLYPLAVLLTAWGLGVSNSQPRHWAWIIGVFLGFGTKGDAPFILFPLLLWFAFEFWRKRRRKELTLASAAILIGATVSALLFLSIRRFSAGAWGPHLWSGAPVHLTQAMPYLQSIELNPSAALGLLKKASLFWISRPWLSLLIFAPWLALTARFWVWLLPIGCVLAILGGQPATLVNYYSASLLGGFWLAVSLTPVTQRRRAWLLFSVLALGSGAPSLPFPSAEALTLRSQAEALLKCLPPENAKGIVSPAMLGVLRNPFGNTGFEDSVLADRLTPEDHPLWPSVNYLLLTPTLSRWEMNETQSQKLIERAGRNPKWRELSTSCQEGLITPAEVTKKNVVLLRLMHQFRHLP